MGKVVLFIGFIFCAMLQQAGLLMPLLDSVLGMM